jgi:hypothetical protein
VTLPVVRLQPLTADSARALETAFTAEGAGFNWGGHRDAGWLTPARATRSTHFRAGTWHDSVLYAVVRGDW